MLQEPQIAGQSFAWTSQVGNAWASTGSRLTMAFHPIVDVEAGSVWGYEALARGTRGETALSLLDRVTDENQFRFDIGCRSKAIEWGRRLLPQHGETRLAINIIPDEVTASKAAIKASLDAAQKVGFDHRRIVFEFNETRRAADVASLARMIEDYRRIGFKTAIDDFGSGHAGLTLLARVQPDLIKLDMDLVTGIAGSATKQMIVAGIVAIAKRLGIAVAAKGVETVFDMRVLKAAGILLQQGFYFAHPALEALPICRVSEDVAPSGE